MAQLLKTQLATQLPIYNVGKADLREYLENIYLTLQQYVCVAAQNDAAAADREAVGGSMAATMEEDVAREESRVRAMIAAGKYTYIYVYI